MENIVTAMILALVMLWTYYARYFLMHTFTDKAFLKCLAVIFILTVGYYLLISIFEL